jgi:hypothetical protein
VRFQFILFGLLTWLGSPHAAIAAAPSVCFTSNPGTVLAKSMSTGSLGVADFLGDGSTVMVTNGPSVDSAGKVANVARPFTAIRIGTDGAISDISTSLMPDAPGAVHARSGMVGDFNNSGRPSFLSGNHGYDATPFPGEKQTLLLSDGTGRLIDKSATLSNLVNFAHSIAAADVSGNGRWDILIGEENLRHNDVVPALGPNTIPDFNTGGKGYLVGPYMLRNDGTGKFSYDNVSLAETIAFPFNRAGNPWVPWTFPGSFTAAKFVDVQNRGLPDLVLGKDASGVVTAAIYANNGKGQFLGTPQNLPDSPYGSANIEVIKIIDADIRGVGLRDLILVELYKDKLFGPGFLQYLTNQGDGTFVDETSLRFPAQGQGTTQFFEDIAVADLNGDGAPDLVLRGYLANTDTAIWLNDGTAKFTPLARSLLTGNGGELIPIDYAHTGVPSLLAFGGNFVTLFKNCSTAVYPQTGWWWNASEGGRGYSLERRGANIFFAGFMYDSSGDPVWYATTLSSIAGNKYQGRLTQYGGGQTLTGAYVAPTSTTQIGTITLTLTDESHGALQFTADAGTSTTTTIERFPIIAGGLTAPPMRSFEPETGWWYNAAEGGRGYFLETQRGSMFFAGYMYSATGKPIWFANVFQTSSPKSASGQLAQYGGGQILGGAYKAATITNGSVGAITLSFISSVAATLTLPNGRQIALTRYRF